MQQYSYQVSTHYYCEIIISDHAHRIINDKPIGPEISPLTPPPPVSPHTPGQAHL